MGSRLTVEAFGTKIWRNEDGKRHREDAPAVILTDGSEVWYLNGKRHREDGPAMICSSGTKLWFQNDKKHRTDGPAVIWADGTEEWFLNGKKLSFTEWADELNLDQKTRLEMVMKWGT